MANLTCTAPVNASVAAIETSRKPGIGEILRAAVELVMLWQARAAQRRTLAELDDHLLEDVGLNRAEVEAEIGKRFWQA